MLMYTEVRLDTLLQTYVLIKLSSVSQKYYAEDTSEINMGGFNGLTPTSCWLSYILIDNRIRIKMVINSSMIYKKKNF